MAAAERELIQAAMPTQGAEAEWMPQPYRWTREQFYQMGDLGLFDEAHMILVEGEIFAMPPMKPLHPGMTTIAGEVMRAAFGVGFVIREQGPFDLGTATDPLPDVAVVDGSLRDFLLVHPARAALIVEVSDSTLAYDRGEKMSLYARAGIADYWIININGAQTEVDRQPTPDEAQPHGFGYAERTIHQSGEIIQPLASPEPIAVSII